MNRNEYEYARIVAHEADKPFEEVVELMTAARDQHGITFQQYYKEKLYKFSKKSWVSVGERLAKRAKEDVNHYKNVSRATGWSEAEVRSNLRTLNDNPYAKVDIAQFDDLKLYAKSRLEVEGVLKDIRDRRVLVNQLSVQLKKIDAGEETYDNIRAMLGRYYQVTFNTILNSEIDEMREAIEKSAPDALKDAKRLRTLATDVLVCKRLLGFLDFEYFMFELEHKSIEVRRTYISNSYRMNKVGKVNDRIKGELFDDKEKTYEMFKEFYGREAVSIHSDEDYGKFVDFCKGRSSFVRKPLTGSMGRGVGLEKISKNTDLKKLFRQLREEMQEFMLEECILNHPVMKKLNPDSVNTVRLTTYHDGEKTHFLWPWVKIGRAGSFVDNAGSGGLGAAIDVNTGMVVSNAMDERGFRCSQHPDNGTVFIGYQLEDWDAALELGRQISQKLVENVDGVRFVGWDITYTVDKRWVVVEGNTFPQIVQQGCMGRGLRAELDAVIP